MEETYIIVLFVCTWLMIFLNHIQIMKHAKRWIDHLEAHINYLKTERGFINNLSKREIRRTKNGK